MTATAEGLERALIDSVCAGVAGRVAADLVGQCEAFVRRFCHSVPAEDLAGRTAHELRAAAIAGWELARDRQTDAHEPLRVTNSSFRAAGQKHRLVV